MVDRSVIAEMLDDLRFDEAERLISDEPDPSLRDELARRRADAEENARSLYQRIVELGEGGDQVSIVELAENPSTRRLLALLSETSRRRGELYLRDAERWQAKRYETNTRRLEEAQRALEGLDLELARGLVNKLDRRFLSKQHQEQADRLILDISARALETESLDETGRQLIEEYESHRRRRKQPWWRRWFD